MLQYLGLLGGFFFGYSGVPVAINAIKKGSVIGMPISTIWSVLLGAWCSLLYLWLKNGFDWVITLDYGVTIWTWTVVARYYYFPRRS